MDVFASRNTDPGYFKISGVGRGFSGGLKQCRGEWSCGVVWEIRAFTMGERRCIHQRQELRVPAAFDMDEVGRGRGGGGSTG
jgi:hypothetical protein